ncbi:biotin--[acetyl-CoA-carboxylase] ligase [Xenophilus arseniciresistens]|uniref:Biotin--[acetyl-CoA-carboxylase] ligase n=1 Tax=Xenophilus arseniciresistens TaxID=1283306 RepID=A0AAE3NCB1_9BURK|nr:biotin--[acetyl-CoA-carboxylase] ligase [Xenophilus arseniciresistens]MDA7418494.1 biotin--[acetyl-CoA-carboxylase] ligase [Xenophilus arseniciresistens]
MSAPVPEDTQLQPLREALAQAWPGLRLEWRKEVDSTNLELMRRARAGEAEPVLLVAQRQTAGRGRLGRAWQSAQQVQDPAASLTFSLGLPLAPQDWSGLSLAVGVSVAESLDADGAAGLRLKWPNDLWVQQRKLGGILIETAALAAERVRRYVVIGIGLNIGERPGTDMRTPPAWVRQWWPQATPLGALAALAPALAGEVRRFEHAGFAPVQPRFAARDALMGQDVHLSDGREGRCEGVGPGGELRVRTAQGLEEISSAEVSVRPRGMAL